MIQLVLVIQELLRLPDCLRVLLDLALLNLQCCPCFPVAQGLPVHRYFLAHQDFRLLRQYLELLLIQMIQLHRQDHWLRFDPDYRQVLDFQRRLVDHLIRRDP